MTKQYAERDAFELDESGGHYMRNVMAMTAEQLHSKSDIAAELAWRDSQIAALQQKLDALADKLARSEGYSVGVDAERMEYIKKCNAMAAENASFKSKLMFWDAEDPEAPYDCPEDIANNCCIDVGVEFDVKVAARMPDRTYRVSSADDYSCSLEIVSAGIQETPATDTYLNSVRAESWADALIMVKSAIFTDSIDHIDFLFNGKIEQLRSGTHDTADKAG